MLKSTINYIVWLIRVTTLVSTGLLFFTCENKLTTIEDEKQIKKAEEQWITPPPFNADSAYEFIKNQVDFGPRKPKSSAHKKCGDWIINKLNSYGYKTTEQIGTVNAFDGTKLPLRNIISQLNPSKKNRILLCAHWDTRPFADRDSVNKNQPIVGANDGGSGVGILIEIARSLKLEKCDKGVDIIFFDVEDYGAPSMNSRFFDIQSMNDSWCLGSQYWAYNLSPEYIRPKYGILLDMVGAENAEFPKEGISRKYAGYYQNKLWNMASKIGHGKYFKKKIAPPITDDHTYINEMTNIPTLDIIHYAVRGNSGNFDFGKFHHTHSDNMNVIHKPTLLAVGETVLCFIYNI
jgi:glutaminyl-peptide cyclotransferase